MKIKFTGERMIPEINLGATFYFEHLNRYNFANQFVTGKNVVDVACGVGYGSYLLATSGAKSVFGIDISKKAIKYAQSKYRAKNLKFKVLDAFKLDLARNSIDVAISFEFIEHITNQDGFLQEVLKIMKRDGILVISTPNKITYPSGNKFHKKELDLKDFKVLLNKYFKNVVVLNQSFLFTNFITNSEPTNYKNTSIIVEEIFYDHFNENTQYYVAVCTNGMVPKIKQSQFITDNVDGLDISSGAQVLGKRVADLNEELRVSKKRLERITSSRAYKIWRYFSNKDVK